MHLLKRLEARWSHQPQGVAFTVRVHATDISWAGIKQPWTAVSVVLGLVSFAAVFRDVTQRCVGALLLELSVGMTQFYF